MFGRLLAATAVVAVVVIGALVAVDYLQNNSVARERCVVQTAETRTAVDLEQAQWSSLFAAIAEQRGLPPRATTIAIATAFQESRIHNINYGDRDSVGLFQQRPSQGWGTVEEIMDPVYATHAFYDGLVEVNDYESLEITVAAQAVQRSAFPDAYAQHEERSRAMATALRGYSAGAWWCELNPRDAGSIDAVTERLALGYGAISTETVSEDTLRLPVGDDETLGWSYAHYLAANAAALRLESIEFSGQRWDLTDSTAGWVADDQAETTDVIVTVQSN